jgi:hypothetical protein
MSEQALTPALGALFALSKRIQKQLQCGEITAFIIAKHKRPDLYARIENEEREEAAREGVEDAA